MIKERMKEVMKRKKDQKSSPERAKEELIKTLKKSYTKTKYQKLETFLNSPEKADYDHKISLLRVSEEDPLSLSSKNHANTLSDTKRKRVKMKSYSIMNGERAHYNESLLLRKRSLQRKKQHSRLSQMRSNVIAVSYHGSELFPLPDQRSGRGNGTSGSKRHTSEDNYIRRNRTDFTFNDNYDPIENSDEEINEERKLTMNPYLHKTTIKSWYPSGSKGRISERKQEFEVPVKNRTIDYTVGVGKKSPRMKFKKPILRKRSKYIYRLM